MIITGIIFAPIAYFLITSVPLTAIGISTIIIGFVSLALANSRRPISPEASELLFRAGMENMAALIEEFGIKNKAIYLPSAMLEGRSRAVIPLEDTIELEHIIGKISERLIVRYGDNPEKMAIAVTTPGNIKVEGFEVKAGTTPAEIEATMTHELVGILDLADSITVNMDGTQVDVVVNGARLHYEDIAYYRCLGSPIASIVANITCESMEKPVRIVDESYQRGENHILLEVLP